MEKTLDLDEPEIARRILAYLLEHPDSEDTIEGVAMWWVLQQSARIEIERVRRAITELVSNNWVLERKGADFRTLYRVNRCRVDEIKDLIG